MTLRVACAGAGFFSQFHTGSWQRIAEVSLVAVCDLDQAKAAAVGVAAYTDLNTMLAEAQPDVLDIVLPPAAQADAIRAAVSYGRVRAIICQKPFCRDLQEAQAMVDLAAQAGIPLVVHENFRFQPWFRKIKQVIDAGTLGDVLQVTFRLRPGDGQGADAYLARQPYFRQMDRFMIHETGVHYVDTFRYLLGPATAVYADLRRTNPVISGEDAGYVIFQHEGGTRALLDGNRSLDHAAENTRCTMGEGLIEGTKGVLSLTGDGAVTLRRFGTQDVAQILPPDTHDGFGGDCTHALQLHVISALLHGTEIENTARQYLDVLRVEEAIYLSAETEKNVKV